MNDTQERLREIRRRIADQDTWPTARADIRFLLAQLAIANSREEQLVALCNDVADRLKIAPCQDIVRPIERVLRAGLQKPRPSHPQDQRQRR